MIAYGGDGAVAYNDCSPTVDALQRPLQHGDDIIEEDEDGRRTPFGTSSITNIPGGTNTK